MEQNELLTAIREATRKLESKARHEQQANRLFLKNLAFFQKYDDNIYRAFSDYKPERLTYDFCPDGSLNVLEPESQLPLYDDDPWEQCRLQVEEYSRKAYCSNMFFGNQPNDRDEIHFTCQNKLVDFRVRCMEEDQADVLVSLPESVPALVLVGVGLGYYLEALLSRTTPNHLYVYEAEMDLFYASLMTVDWEAIFEKIERTGGSIFFDIGSDPADFVKNYQARVCRDGRFYVAKTYIYQHYPSQKNHQALVELSQAIKDLIGAWGFFDDGLLAIAHGIETVRQQIPFLHVDGKLPRACRDTPVFIVANGPSLDKTIDAIRQYQDNALIISCGSALDSLYSYGVKPHIQVEVERVLNTTFRLERLKNQDPDFFAGIVLAANHIQHPGVYSLFERAFVGMKGGEGITAIMDDLADGKLLTLSHSNPMAANIGVSIATFLGFREIYLFGVDCGYYSGGHHHSIKSPYYHEDGKDKEAYTFLGNSALFVPGNFDDQVETSFLLNLSRKQIENAIYLGKQRNRGCQYYNCSHGARIEGAIPLPAEDILLVPGCAPGKVVDAIFQHSVRQPDITPEQIESCLMFAEARALTEKLRAIYRTSYSSRREFMAALLEQSELLFALRARGVMHFMYLFEGSIYTINSMLLQIAYLYEDEQLSMNRLNQALSVGLEFFDEVDKRYPEVVGRIDNVLDSDIRKLYCLEQE